MSPSDEALSDAAHIGSAPRDRSARSASRRTSAAGSSRPATTFAMPAPLMAAARIASRRTCASGSVGRDADHLLVERVRARQALEREAADSGVAQQLRSGPGAGLAHERLEQLDGRGSGRSHRPVHAKERFEAFRDAETIGRDRGCRRSERRRWWLRRVRCRARLLYGRRAIASHSAARTFASASTFSRAMSVACVLAIETAAPGAALSVRKPCAACAIAFAASTRTSGSECLSDGRMSGICEGRSVRPSARTAMRTVSVACCECRS